MLLDDKRFYDRAKEERNLEKQLEDDEFNARKQRNTERLKGLNERFMTLHAQESYESQLNAEKRILERQAKDEEALRQRQEELEYAKNNPLR